jgi:putative colanic acid biosynthesis glycosyltransferase
MLFSVITVTYNNLDGLKRTHESLRQQACRDFEWITIDGGSNDDTAEYLAAFSANFIGGPDEGIYDAMNKGLKKAGGEYLLFLNAGDTLADFNILQKIKKNIEGKVSYPDFIYGDSYETGQGRGATYRAARSHKKPAYGMFTHHQAMLYRRARAEGLRYDLNYGIAADYKFTLQFLKRCKQVLYCPYAICVYEGGGLSRKYARKGRREQFFIRSRETGISQLQNISIYFGQMVFMRLRRWMPWVYWRLKQKRCQTMRPDNLHPVARSKLP